MILQEPNLQPGLTGDDVRLLHAALTLLNLAVPDNKRQAGLCGPITQRLIQDLQLKRNFPVPITGIVDAATARGINSDVDALHPPTSTVSRRVYSAQRAEVDGLGIQVVDKNAGPDVPLAEGNNNDGGAYSVRYATALLGQSKSAPDIQVRALTGSTLLATGKERAEETGFTYHGARLYLPWLGRWASTDPAGFVGGPNLYCYVSGNPLQYTDPTGMGPLDSQIYRKERDEVLEQQQAKFEIQHSEFTFKGLNSDHIGQLDVTDVKNWADCWDRKVLWELLKPFLNVTNEHYFGRGAYWLALDLYNTEFYSSGGRADNLVHNRWEFTDPWNPHYSREELTESDDQRYRVRLKFADYGQGELIPSTGLGSGDAS